MARISEPGAGAVHKAKQASGSPRPMVRAPDAADANAKAIVKRYSQPAVRPNPDTRASSNASAYEADHRQGHTATRPLGSFTGVRPNPDQQRSGQGRRIPTLFPGTRPNPDEQPGFSVSSARRYMEASQPFKLPGPGSGLRALPDGRSPRLGEPGTVVTSPFSTAMYEATAVGAMDNINRAFKSVGADKVPWARTITSRVDPGGNLRFYTHKGDEVIPGEHGDGAYAHDPKTGVTFSYPHPIANEDGGGIAGPSLSVAEWGLRQAVRPLHGVFAAGTELVKGHGLGAAAKEGIRGLENKNTATGSDFLGALGAHGLVKHGGGLLLDLGVGALYPTARLGSLAEDEVNTAQRFAEEAGHEQATVDSAIRAGDNETAVAANARAQAARQQAKAHFEKADAATHHKGVAVTVGGKVPFGPRLQHEFGMKTTSTANRVLTGNKQRLRGKGFVAATGRAFAPDMRSAEFTVPTFMKTRQLEGGFRAHLSNETSSQTRKLHTLKGATGDVTHSIEGAPKTPFGHYVHKGVDTPAYAAEKEAFNALRAGQRRMVSLKRREAYAKGGAEALVPLHNRAVLTKALRIAKVANKQGSGPAAEVLDNYRKALGARIGASNELAQARRAYRNATGKHATTNAQLFTKGGRERLPSMPANEEKATERLAKAEDAYARAKANYPHFERAMIDFATAEHGHVTRLKAAEQKAIGYGRHGNPGEVAPLEVHPGLEEEYGSSIRQEINANTSPELRRAVTRIVVRPPHPHEQGGLMGYFEPHSGEVHILMHPGQELSRLGESMRNTMVHEAGHAKSIPEVTTAATPHGVYHLRHIARSLMDAFPAHESDAGNTLHSWFSAPGRIGIEHIYSRGDFTQAAEILARLVQLHHEDPIKFLETIGPHNAHFLDKLTTDVMGLSHAKARAGALNALKRQVKIYGSFETDASGIKSGNIEQYDKNPTGRLARLEKLRGEIQQHEKLIPGLRSMAQQARAERLEVGEKEDKWFVAEFGPLPEGKAIARSKVSMPLALVEHAKALASLDASLRHAISRLPAKQQGMAHAIMAEGGRMYDVEHLLGLVEAARPNYIFHTLSLDERAAREKGVVRKGVSKGFGPDRKRFYDTLTIKEINALRYRQDPNLPPLMEVDPVVIQAARGLKHAQATAQAKFYADLKATVGMPWHPGMEVPEHYGVYKLTPKSITALTTDAERERAHLEIARDPHSDITVLPHAVYERLIRSPHLVSELGKKWDRLIATIKSGQTALNMPRHQLSNFMGDGINAFIGGVGADDFVSTVRIVKRMVHRDRAEMHGEPYVRDHAEVNIRGRRWNIDDLINALRDHGIPGTGYSGGELTNEVRGEGTIAIRNMAGKRRVNTGFLAGVRRFDTWRESFWRIATALGAKRRNWSWQQARRHVDDWHFDYQDLTDTEHRIRRVVPFYTFMARDTRAQTRGVLMHTGKYAQIEATREEIAKAQGLDLYKWEQGLPAYQQQGVPVPLLAKLLPQELRGGVGGNTPLAMTLTGTPLSDLNRIPAPWVQGGVVNAGLNALSGFAPPVRLTVEEIMNHSAFFKSPIRPDAQNPYVPQKAPAGTLIQILGHVPVLKDLLGYVDQFHAPDGSVKPGYSPSIDYALHGVFPQLNIALGAGLQTTNPRGQTLLQKLAGYSAINISNPNASPINAAYTAVGQFTVQLRELEGQGKKGSPEWRQVYEARRLAGHQLRYLSMQRKRKGAPAAPRTDGIAPPPPPPPAPPPALPSPAPAP